MVLKALEEICEWEEDENGAWETTCDNLFEFIEGTPEDNGMSYCCFCGKPIKTILEANNGKV